jgi:AraC-like DNA-binding protein
MNMLFRSEAAPVASRLDYWRHVVGDTIVPIEIRPWVSAADLREETRVAEAGPVRVNAMTLGPGEAARTSRLIRRSDPGVCKIDVVTSGQLVVDQGGRQARLGPGDFALIDLSRPARWSTSGPARGVAVMFPRVLLPRRRTDFERLTGVRIAGDRGAGGLASSVARQLPRHLDGAASGERAHLGTIVVDLLSVALAARLDTTPDLTYDGRRRVLLARIHAYVEERLGDGDLTPATIAAAHHISVRYLHKLFEQEQTTVAGHVRRRRLERCRQDLLDSSLAGRPVSAIASRWGFSNSAYFNRVFRAAYDAPPGEFRRLAAHEFPSAQSAAHPPQLSTSSNIVFTAASCADRAGTR